ncbi:ubiquitin carboxyl-terminal hydrolase MINDY-2 [Galendromus occidentalis]|uniref:Ubiquitin carboxyl-terminal hydrolase n=1 Tax=Galendromus occidentalis TaxID=34638 RepID=A0AAJ6W0G6_9ACAR|nr:ubiquitin carboxyl-terminal hydrolase MINDY-2 [Galendromus occidentalis]
MAESPRQSAYHIKWVHLSGVKYPIITQNENGPCPLLAIINLLILRGLVQLPPMVEIITADQLMEYLGDAMLAAMPKDLSESAQLNYEQNMNDAMTILPKLQTGLDVNVRFTGVRDFEYTPECTVFDHLQIPLYHGWLVDPQEAEMSQTIGKLSYNQLVEKIINEKTSDDQVRMAQALICEDFLERTASQLTMFGIRQLLATMKDHELAVLFRNNHFSTLMKHNNQLYQLVTDQGFLTEHMVVWESLTNVEGDGQFTDGDFGQTPPQLSREQQIEQDEQLARQMQMEEEEQAASAAAPASTPTEVTTPRAEGERRPPAEAPRDPKPESRPPQSGSPTGSNASNSKKSFL